MENVGYRRKPAWIYLTALAFMLAPVGNTALVLQSLGLLSWDHREAAMAWLSNVSPGTWLLFGLVFLSGVALLFVRRWSLHLTLGTLAIVVLYNIVNFQALSVIGAWKLGAMIIVTVGLLLSLYFSEFRVPYVNPRLRWWETAPRFRVDLKARETTLSRDLVIVDISRTGVLAEMSAEGIDVGQSLKLELPMDLKLAGRIARKSPNGQIGIEFVELDRTGRKHLKTFLDQLRDDPSKILR